MKKTLHTLLATILIIIGIAGLVLPILNGTLFLLLGFILLSFENPDIEERIERIVQKNAYLNMLHKKLHRWMKKIFK